MLKGGPRKHSLWLLSLTIVMAMLSVSCRQGPRVEKTTQLRPPAEKTVKESPLQTPSPILGKAYPGAGVITLINRKEGWVEIDHKEIKGLMPAMTMEFWVKDKSLFNNVEVGDRVDFTVVEAASGEFVTELRKIGTGQ